VSDDRVNPPEGLLALLALGLFVGGGCCLVADEVGLALVAFPLAALGYGAAYAMARAENEELRRASERPRRGEWFYPPRAYRGDAEVN